MTEIQQYLAEEVAEDLADGIINRREAIRRLGLLGLTGTAATGLLSAFAASEAAAKATEARRPTPPDAAGRRRTGRRSPVSRSRSRDRVGRCWPRGRPPPSRVAACSSSMRTAG